MSEIKYKDMIGKKIGKWTVISKAPSDISRDRRSYKAVWNCICECGITKQVSGDRLRRGTSLSCGKGHAMPRPLENIHDGMIQRCTNPNNKRYADYGGRGVSVCERWLLSYKHFQEDMGVRPTPEHSIDRIDNNGNYEPGNCKWSTKEQQSSNMRTNIYRELNGVRLTHSQWARKIGISSQSLSKRIAKWPIEKALTQLKRNKGECK